MKYTIAYHNPTTQYIPVTALISSPNNITSLQFPQWRPGRYELGNFAKNIHGFEVLDENGKRLKFYKTSKASWEVETQNCNEIKVRYRYFAAELNAGSSFMDNLQLYVNPINLLVYSKDLQNEPCTLQIMVPEQFEIACGPSINNNIIETQSFHELVDSPFIASANLKHYHYTVKDITFNLWIQGEAAFEEEKVCKDFEKFTQYQLEKFDGFETKSYHFFYQILPIRAYHGVEHTTSTVIALGPGNELMTTLYDDFLGVSSHELYHVWNIKSIRPLDMQPYDYSKENYSFLGYVAEGVTTYMGDLILSASNVKDFNWYKLEFEKLLQKHFDNFGRFNYSVADSSYDTWLDGYVPGAPNRKVSIYNEGALLSFVVDIEIRNATNNKASLHDLMNQLYCEFGKKNKGYTANDFFGTAGDLAGIDFSRLRQKYYYGTHSYEPIIVKALSFLALDLKMEKNPSSSIDLLGLKTIPYSTKYMVKGIYPGSGSELGGLMYDDILTKINKEEINLNLDDLVSKYGEGELEIEVIRMGRTEVVKIPHTNKSYFPVYKLIKHKTQSNLSKRMFKSWCGYDYDAIVF